MAGDLRSKMLVSIAASLLALIISSPSLFGSEAVFLQESGAGQPAVETDKLEIFSWWTAPGEKEGLEFLQEYFQDEYREIEVVNAAVEGGAGVNAKDVLKMRLLREDPPDAFQVHGGAELSDTFVAGDYIKPLTDLWQDKNWEDVYTDSLRELVRVDGEYFSLPVAVHRSNRIWYNRDMLAEHGLKPPRTPKELIETAEILSEAGEKPLALGSRNLWPITHLFENLLVAEAEPAEYRALISGRRSWQNQEVFRALEKLAELFEYADDDHAGLTWHEACERVARGEAAMTVMGTWSRGYFSARGYEPGEDYGSVPLQGEEETFLKVVDTFAVPAAADNNYYNMRWLEFAARPEIQRRFTAILGAVPPRSDIDPSRLEAGIAADRRQLEKQELLPSLAHGAAAREVFVSALNEKLNEFLYHGDIENTAAEIDDIVTTYLP